MKRQVASAMGTIVVIASLGLGAPPVRAQGYSVVSLGTLGGNDSESRGINSAGHVVGWSDIAVTFDDHAFNWNGVSMIDLGTLGGRQSIARAINDSDVIAGRADYNYWFQHACRWIGNQKTDLGTLGGRESSAYDINNAGQIVGWADLSTGAPRAFRWQNNVMTDLGTLGGVSSEARGINAAGDVCGFSYIPGGVKHAFLWRNDQMTDLGTLGGPRSQAFALNSNNQIVGDSDTAAGPSHAFLWNNGTPVDLGTLGGTDSQALDINNLGEIVGWAEDANEKTRAFLRRNGVMLNLNDLIPPTSGWLLKEAAAINEDGEIAGHGTYAGQTRAFLLVPDGSEILILTGPIPGIAGQTNRFDVDGASPSARVRFLYSLRSGTWAVPGCTGVTLGLNNPVEFGSAIADGNGHATVSVSVPGSARGVTAIFQSYEQSTCRVTNIVTYTFQ